MSTDRTGRLWDALVIGVYGLLAARSASVVEDAYISFRYARHLVEGHGLRYNLGEDPPVEGFSNLLLVLLAALFEAVGLSPEVGVPIVTALCGAGVVAFTLHVARAHLGIAPWPSRWAALALAMLPPFASWATSGLEPMAQTLCFLVGAALLTFSERTRDAWIAGAAGLALGLLRTEGLAWAPVFLALAAWVRASEGRPLWPAFSRFLAVVVPGGALYVVWKLQVFGSLTSNVALAKANLGPVAWWRGLSYVTTFQLVELWPLPATLLGGWWGWRRLGAHRTRALWVVLLAFAAPAWAVVVGGDYMAWFRFLIPSLPFMALALAMMLQAVFLSLQPPAAHALGAAIAVVGLLPEFEVVLVPQPLLVPLDYSTPSSAEGEPVFRRGMFVIPGTTRFLEWEAKALGAFVKPGQTVVTSAIGLYGYRNPDLEILDLCGLVEPTVARREVEPSPDKRPGHEKCVGPSFFLDRNPDVLVFDTAHGRAAFGEMRDKARTWKRKFPDKRYAPAVVVLPADVPGGWMFGYGLRRVPAQLDAAELWRAFERRVDELEAKAPAGKAEATPE